MLLNPIKNTPLRSIRMDLETYNKARTLNPCGLERQLLEAGLSSDNHIEIVLFEHDPRDLEFITEKIDHLS